MPPHHPQANLERLRLAIATNVSMTGTSTRTPTTVARAAPLDKPNSPMATATASSKKLDVPISAQGTEIDGDHHRINHRPYKHGDDKIGAGIALLAIFLPGFLLLIGALPFWDGLRSRAASQATMRGANAAVVVLLACLGVPLGLI